MLRTALLFLAAMTIAPSSGAQPVFSDPIEYLNDGQGNFVGLADGQQDLVKQKVEVNGEGDRADRWITGVTQSSVTLFNADKPTAVALVCPGGGYFGLSFDKEGTFVAKWLAERGITAGVLKSPIATGEPLRDAPLKAANAALRWLKGRHPGLPAGIVGFSAGGHLAASAGTPVKLENEATVKLDFQVLVYPVLSFADDVTHGGSRNNILGKEPSENEIERWSTDKQVTPATPATLLIHTADDTAVPLENSLLYLEACRKAGVSCELHAYPTGGHGYGMWRDEGTIATWPAAMDAWLRAQSLTK